MPTQVKIAENIFNKHLNGRGEVDVIHQAFKQNGLFDTYSDDYKIHRFEMSKTRELLRRISIVIDTSEGRTKIRGVHNIEKWKDGKPVFEYALLRKMTLEEIELVARRYQKTARVYMVIGDALMEVVTGQMLLFDVRGCLPSARRVVCRDNQDY